MSGSRPWIAAAGFLTLIVPAARAQAVAFFPGVQSFPNGVVMSATPAVSYDRRYVRLNMVPQFTVLEGFDTYLVPAAVSGVGPLGGGAGGAGGGGAGGLVGFAGMNGPIGAPMPQSNLPQDGWSTPGRPSASSDFEDQLRATPAPERKLAARPAPTAKAKRKAATKAPRSSTSARSKARKGAQAR